MSKLTPQQHSLGLHIRVRLQELSAAGRIESYLEFANPDRGAIVYLCRLNNGDQASVTVKSTYQEPS